MLRAATLRVLRFGVFEADPRSGEIRKGGVKIKIQEKPFQLLVVLLEHPGDVVTRDELRQKLWPSDTFVDFDHSLGTAIAKLRQALGDSAQNPRFVETVASRGYRFIAPVTQVGNDVASVSVSVPPLPRTPATTPKLSNRVHWLAGSVIGLMLGALLAAAVLGFNIGGARQRLRRLGNPPVRSLAVLPLANLSGDPSQEYFADGMTEQLITNLAQLPNLHVISRTSVMQYQGNKKSLQQIGRELNVDAVVEGAVMQSGKRVLITAQLLDARTDTHLWAQRYERDLDDVLILQSEISSAIAHEIQVKLTPQQESDLSSTARVNPEVQDAYLKGRYHLNKGGEGEIRKAIEYFQQALTKDPNDARSYAGLSDSYFALDEYYEAPWETMPKAKEAAQKAVSLSPRLAEAHVSLGTIRFNYDWDWIGAEQEMKRAIELNPNSADAHIGYGAFLASMGRGPQATTEIKRAEALDPLSLPVHVQAGWVFYVMRNNAEAIAEWGKAIDLDPTFTVLHSSMWAAYLQKPEFHKVLVELPEETVVNQSPVNLAALAGSYAVAGKKTEAEQVLAKLKRISKFRYVCPYEMGTAEAMLGNNDEAIGWLQKAYEIRSICMTGLKTDPRLDVLRADPRFQELLRSLQFPL